MRFDFNSIKNMKTLSIAVLTIMAAISAKGQTHEMNIEYRDGSNRTVPVSSITFEKHTWTEGKELTAKLSENILPYPERFNVEAEKRGKVVRMDYDTRAYNTGETITKSALVYLPYGYDPNDIRRYNVFYMMHGMGDRFDTYLKAPGSTSELKRALDHLIQDGEIEPLIVVTPSFYIPEKYDQSEVWAGVANFPKELIYDLMPAVASSYRTYATATDPSTFEQTRSHRAFGGFSAGSVTCWNVFNEDFRYFREYVPMSGAMNLFTSSTTDGLSSALASMVDACGYGQHDFYINAISGSEDYDKSGLASQITTMGNHSMFTIDKDKSTGNICYREFAGGKHDYSATVVYIYNSLLSLFR